MKITVTVCQLIDWAQFKCLDIGTSKFCNIVQYTYIPSNYRTAPLLHMQGVLDTVQLRLVVACTRGSGGAFITSGLSSGLLSWLR